LTKSSPGATGRIQSIRRSLGVRKPKKAAGLSPAASMLGWATLLGRSASGLTEIHLEIAQVNLGVALTFFGLLVDLRPPLRVGLERPGLPGSLVLALAVDARVGVRESVQPGFGDLAAAKLASAINSGTDSLQSMLDLSELTTLDFDKLRADLVVRRVNGCINIIADRVELRKPPEAIQVAVKGFTQSISPCDKPGSQS
jgi:hypothetical protein